MRITINNESVEISSDRIFLSELLEIRGIRQGGTAVAVNNRLIKHENWGLTPVNEGDAITLITAAFGG